MRRVPRQYPNVNVRREHDPRTARRRALLLAGCLALCAGFLFAVRQQIVALELGYKTEALRRERAKLTDEQRSLLLALEERSSPAQLERAARGLGMQPTMAKQIAAAARADVEVAAGGGDTPAARDAEAAGAALASESATSAAASVR